MSFLSFLVLLLIPIECSNVSLLVVDDSELSHKLRLFKYYINSDSIWEDVSLKDVQLKDDYNRYELVVIAINDLNNDVVKLIDENIEIHVTYNLLLLCQRVSTDNVPELLKGLNVSFLRGYIHDSINGYVIKPEFNGHFIEYSGTGITSEDNRCSLVNGTTTSVLDGYNCGDIKLISHINYDGINIIVCGSVFIFEDSTLTMSSGNVKFIRDVRNRLEFNSYEYKIEGPPDGVIHNVNDQIEFTLKTSDKHCIPSIEIEHMAIKSSKIMEKSIECGYHYTNLQLPNHRGIFNISIYNLARGRSLLYNNRVASSHVDVKKYSRASRTAIYMCIIGKNYYSTIIQE